MHTLLEEANLGYSKIMGCGLTEIVGAYIDGCLTLDMCFNVINCIGKHVEEFAKNNSEYFVYYLTLSSIYTHFNTLKKNKTLGKHCGKRWNCSK